MSNSGWFSNCCFVPDGTPFLAAFQIKRPIGIYTQSGMANALDFVSSSLSLAGGDQGRIHQAVLNEKLVEVVRTLRSNGTAIVIRHQDWSRRIDHPQGTHTHTLRSVSPYGNVVPDYLNVVIPFIESTPCFQGADCWIDLQHKFVLTYDKNYAIRLQHQLQFDSVGKKWFE